MVLKHTTREDLDKIPLPEYEDSYTVIKHTKIITLIEEYLLRENIAIENERYYITKNGNVLNGIITLNHELDSECKATIIFENSYDKTKSFSFYASLRMVESGNMIVLGESLYGNYRRRHRGVANEELESNLLKSVQHLKKDFTTLIQQKSILKHKILTTNDVFILLCKLFFEEELIASEQFNFVKKQLHNPEYTYSCSKTSLFHIYMLIALAFQQRGKDPTKFYKCHQALNKYIVDKYGINTVGSQFKLSF